MNVLYTLLRPVGALLVALPLAASQEAEGGLTPWHVAKLQTVASAEISPDGGHVAYVLGLPREPGKDEDGPARSQLHVLDVESGETRPYVTAESGVSSIAWTPDGASIAFLAKREGDDERSLYAIPLAGGEARRLVQLEERGIGAFEIAADGSRVALLAREPKSEEQEKVEKQGFRPEVYEEDWRPVQVWLAELGGEGESCRRICGWWNCRLV